MCCFARTSLQNQLAAHDQRQMDRFLHTHSHTHTQTHTHSQVTKKSSSTSTQMPAPLHTPADKTVACAEPLAQSAHKKRHACILLHHNNLATAQTTQHSPIQAAPPTSPQSNSNPLPDSSLISSRSIATPLPPHPPLSACPLIYFTPAPSEGRPAPTCSSAFYLLLCVSN